MEQFAKSPIWQRPNRPHGAGALLPPLGSDAVLQIERNPTCKPDPDQSPPTPKSSTLPLRTKTRGNRPRGPHAQTTLILDLFVGSTLAGSGVVAALTMGYGTLAPILIAAALGFVLAVPVSTLIAKALLADG